MSFCCIPSDDKPQVEIEIDVSGSCNCCTPPRHKKHKTHNIKNVEQTREVEMTDKKIPKLPVKHQGCNED